MSSRILRQNVCKCKEGQICCKFWTDICYFFTILQQKRQCKQKIATQKCLQIEKEQWKKYKYNGTTIIPDDTL